jgi:inner membrane protein
LPTAIAHSTVALALGSLFPRIALPRWAWWLGVGCAVLPDLDVISFRLGFPYGHLLGHRGLTHSVAFAVMVALISAAIGAWTLRGYRCLPTLLIFVFACTLSHGLLDAMTNGGHGVAFFAPFSNHRYFLPWRPIAVSPLTLTRLLTAKGLQILASETIWVTLPSLLIALSAAAARSTLVRSVARRSGPGYQSSN